MSSKCKECEYYIDDPLLYMEDEWDIYDNCFLHKNPEECQIKLDKQKLK